MSFTKRLLAVAGITTMASVVAFAGPAFATSINGTGTVSCSTLTGTIKFSPPLVAGGSSANETVTVKTSQSGCTGTADGATVVSAKSTGHIKTRNGTNANDCSVLLGASANPLELKTVWKVTKGSPKLNKSSIEFTSVVGGVDGTNHGTFTASGTVTGGSFNGDTASASATTQEDTTQLGSECAGSGISVVHIASGSSSLS